jgi:hypothetical protein
MKESITIVIARLRPALKKKPIRVSIEIVFASFIAIFGAILLGEELTLLNLIEKEAEITAVEGFSSGLLQKL